MKSSLLLLTILAASLVFADDVAANAQRAYESQQWKSAADLYGKLTESEPANALYWYRLGNAARHAQRAKPKETFVSRLTAMFRKVTYRRSGREPGNHPDPYSHP